MRDRMHSPFAAVALVTCALSALFSGCVPSLPGEGQDAGKIVVYRDTWGVPHIFAPTAEEGVYAQGYAQAEDRPEQLLLNLAMGIGEFSKAVGEAGVQVDLRSHMWDHYGVAKRQWEAIPELQRRHLEAFAAGMNAYYDEHPEDRPDWWGDRAVDPYMIVAFGRLFLYNWSIDEAYGDLRRGGIEPNFEPAQRGSNEFSVGPSRSADGVAILAIDPHLSWFGPSRFWEFRIHAGELEGSGVTLPGSPYIGLGHNRYIAWAMTTGGPDTADIYELTLRPGDPHQYRYDNEWRRMTSREVTIEIADAAPRTVTLWSSHHGPIVAWGEGKAYAAKVAYAEEVGVSEAWWKFNTAHDYTGAVDAMASSSLFPQNVMVADTSGNIYYQRTGRVGIRPEGPNFSKPVDGSTSATEWQGIHPASDHLQVLNPPQGWMQNCNIPPDAMMPGSPFSLAKSRDYLFASKEYGARRDGWTNQRGARAVELLSADDSVTTQDAMAYITDIEPYGAERWVELLRRADEEHGEAFAERPHYADAIRDLLDWEGALAAESSGALKYAYWRDQLAPLLEGELAGLADDVDDWYAIVRGEDPKPLPEAVAESVPAAFADAMDRLVDNHGSLDATYGDRFRVGRGDSSWPVEGGGPNGTTTLRNIGYGDERDDHTRWGQSGQTSTQIVVLSEPPQSWIYIPLGESDRPESPHYADQAQQLFSKRIMKPSWWLPADLLGHVEYRTELVRQ